MASRLVQAARFCSTNSIKLANKTKAVNGRDLVEKVAISGDGKTIVAWHPAPEFPFECSQPLPKAASTDSGSLLKESALQTAMRAFKDQHPEVARQELMQLTFTCKHRWFPRPRDRKAKKTPMERPYL